MGIAISKIDRNFKYFILVGLIYIVRLHLEKNGTYVSSYGLFQVELDEGI